VDLGDKLASISEEMDDSERANYKLLLAMAAGGLIVRGDAETRSGSEAYRATLRAIARLQPHHDRIPPNGVIYRGRPKFCSQEMLDDLRAESQELRSSAVRFDHHYVSPGGPIAQGIALSEQLNDLIALHTHHIVPTGRANYLYYDAVDLGIDPHVDNEVFSLNAIMMLEHEFCDNPSALVLYPAEGEAEEIYLCPGEMIVMFADSITHARRRMRPHEHVSIVAFGFQPVGEL
jgi:hypothetical protein